MTFRCDQFLVRIGLLQKVVRGIVHESYGQRINRAKMSIAWLYCKHHTFIDRRNPPSDFHDLCTMCRMILKCPPGNSTRIYIENWFTKAVTPHNLLEYLFLKRSWMLYSLFTFFFHANSRIWNMAQKIMTIDSNFVHDEIFVLIIFLRSRVSYKSLHAMQYVQYFYKNWCECPSVIHPSIRTTRSRFESLGAAKDETNNDEVSRTTEVDGT